MQPTRSDNSNRKLSRLDLPNICEKVRCLYRDLDAVTALRAKWEAAADREPFPADLIKEAIDGLLATMMPSGVHEYRQYEDIDGADLDLEVRATLADLRKRLVESFLVASELARNSGERDQFRVYLETVLVKLKSPAPADPEGASRPDSAADTTGVRIARFQEQGLTAEEAHLFVDEAVTRPRAAANPPNDKAEVEGAKTARGNPRRIPRGEANVLVHALLMKDGKVDPESITRDAVAAATGVSTGGVSMTPAWQDFQRGRKQNRKAKLRTISNADSVLAVVPSDTEKLAEIAALFEEQQRDDAEDNRRYERRHERRHGPS